MRSIWAAQAFWLLLALPGFALLWRCDRASLRGGVRSGVARSYLASFMLLTPISVLGHIWLWPLWTLSGAYLLALALGLFSLAHDPSWLRRPHVPSIAAGLSGLLLLADLLLGARAGTHVGGDAGYHIARVRMLLDLGLNSWDPLIEDLRLDSVYHTNLYHALIACSAQLLHTDPGTAWLAIWPFAKLLTAAASYQLAMVVFGRRWLAWLAATSTLFWYAEYSVLPFPNTLAPAALLPMGFAAAIEALREKPSYRPAVWLAASALALAQFHNLNAAFLAIVVAPCLFATCLLRLLTRRPGARQLLLATLAIGASLPWLLVPALPQLKAVFGAASSAPVATAAAASGNDESVASMATNLVKKPYKAERLTPLADGQYVVLPNELLGSSNRNVLGVCALLFAGLVGRRREIWWLGAFIATTCAWLLVPALCTLLLRVLGAAWAVVRIASVFPIALCTFIPAAAWVGFDRFRRVRALRLGGELAAIALAVLYGVQAGQHQRPWTEREYLNAAANRQSRSSAIAIRERSAYFASSIPVGATVMAHTRWDYNLPMHHRAHLLALGRGRGWHGVANMEERRGEVDEFFALDTSGERRLEILRKYDIHYVYTSRRLLTNMMLSLGTEHIVYERASQQGAILTIAY
jgi:hypothetical protein